MTSLILASLLGVALAAGPDSSAEWPQWRGPHRDGHSPDKGLLQEWSKEGPKLLWETKGGGKGYSSMSIAGGRVFTMGDGPSTAEDKTREYVVAFDQKSGKPLWQTPVGKEWNEGNKDWQGARCTPTVDGERVYALSARGDLVCLEAANGKEVWHKEYTKDFSARPPNWGFTESVLVDGDRLVCTPGSEKHTMVALDKKTGNPVWSCSVPGNNTAGYASIVVSEAGGVHQYVQQTANHIIGVDARDGKLLWKFQGLATTANIPTCIVRGDYVFCDAGYGKGGALLKLVANAGVFKVEEVYPITKALNNKHGGIVLVGDYLYGDKDASDEPFCAEFMTGKLVPDWAKGKTVGKNSMTVTYADNYLYCFYGSADLSLVKATPDGYHEASTFKVPHKGDRPCWAHTAIAGGRLYVRIDDWVMCYDLKGK